MSEEKVNETQVSQEQAIQTPPVIKHGANKGKKKQILFNDTVHNETVDVDSNEEWYTFAYFCELHELGLIKDFVYQPDSFPLTPKFTYIPVDPFGLKIQKPKFLFHAHVYTADFKVTAYVDSPALLLYFTKVFKISPDWIKDDPDTGRKITDIWIDVKGEWMQNGAESFSINQKLVYQMHGIYINKFIPKKAFQEVGAPHLATKTPTGRPSKVFGNMKFIESIYKTLSE